MLPNELNTTKIYAKHFFFAMTFKSQLSEKLTIRKTKNIKKKKT